MDNLIWMMDMLLDNKICTEAELALVTAINGTTEETMKDILYARTGDESFDQFFKK